jgi:hypothetical protein
MVCLLQIISNDKIKDLFKTGSTKNEEKEQKKITHLNQNLFNLMEKYLNKSTIR